MSRRTTKGKKILSLAPGPSNCNLCMFCRRHIVTLATEVEPFLFYFSLFLSLSRGFVCKRNVILSFKNLFGMMSNNEGELKKQKSFSLLNKLYSLQLRNACFVVAAL